MGKDAKCFFQDPIAFETHMSGGDNWKNFVDEGPDTAVKSTLSIMEFDKTLASIVNFSDPEAFKAQVTPVGLEEIRAVVRYELMNLHMLIVGTRHNQTILDNC
jgi:hypothetical protein